MELEFSYLAAKFAATDEYDWQGFDSPIGWLKANCHMSGGAASARICAGEQVEHLGQSSKAMAAGEIGFAHFALIARTSAAVGERLDEAKLLGQARKQTIARFHDSCYHARHAADPEGCAKDEAQSVEARSLTFANGDDGMVHVNGMLDKIGGAAVQAALEPLAQRTGKDDDRCRERRVADALVDVCMHALDNGVPSRRTHMQGLGLGGYRCRERPAGDLGLTGKSAQGARPWVCLAWMRPAGDLDLGSPRCALDQWRIDRPLQPRPSLLPAPLDGA